MIGGFYQGLSKGDGYIYMYAIPNEEIKESEISKNIEAYIAEAIDTKITQEKLSLEEKIFLRQYLWNGWNFKAGGDLLARL